MTNSEDKTTPPLPSFANRVRNTMTRLGLNEKETAEYLAIPLFTLRKWIRGEREPTAAVIRVISVTAFQVVIIKWQEQPVRCLW